MVKKLYPFAGRFLDLNGLRYHYLDEGAGQPVVMLHGNPTWSFYYRNLVQALRGNYRTIVPDHIGCGLSDKPDDAHYSYCLDQRVQDLERLLDHLDIRKNITFVLHDWGGIIGMAYAIRHPGRIGRLIVFNTAAFHLPKDKAFPWPLQILRDTPVGTLLVRGLNAFSLAAAAFCCARHPLPRAVRKAYLAPYNSWHNRIAVLRFVQDIPLNPGDPSYGAVSVVEGGLDRLKDIPMLVCWGLRDFVFDKHFLAQWLRYFPNAEFHAFAEAGHYVLEDACEEIIPLVDAFLKKHPMSIA